MCFWATISVKTAQTKTTTETKMLMWTVLIKSQQCIREREGLFKVGYKLKPPSTQLP